MECINIHNRQRLPAQKLPVRSRVVFWFLVTVVVDQKGIRHGQHLSHVHFQPRLLSSEYLRLDLRSLRCLVS